MYVAATNRVDVMNGAILTPRAAALERIKALVLDTLPSPESKRAYGQALDDFFRWCGADVAGGFTKATVTAYRADLEARRLSSSTINQRLSAIRKLAMEAADNGFMLPEQASAISRVKGAKQSGIRTGQWLTREQAERLIAVPNPATLKGARDRALLGIIGSRVDTTSERRRHQAKRLKDTPDSVIPKFKPRLRRIG